MPSSFDGGAANHTCPTAGISFPVVVTTTTMAVATDVLVAGDVV